MGLLEVTTEFKKLGFAEKIIIQKENTATVQQAANALQIDADQIAKTLALKTNDQNVLIVMAGSRKIDNTKFKKEFGKKGKMLTPEEAFELTGHPVGGICPFALKENLPVYLDISLKKHDAVYPACGDAHSAIKLSISELETLSHMTSWVDVCNEQNKKP